MIVLIIQVLHHLHCLLRFSIRLWITGIASMVLVIGKDRSFSELYYLRSRYKEFYIEQTWLMSRSHSGSALD